MASRVPHACSDVYNSSPAPQISLTRSRYQSRIIISFGVKLVLKPKFANPPDRPFWVKTTAL